MSHNAIYTDLSGYYDLMCADIDYPAQSRSVQRIHQLFGNGGQRHLDLACGTGPHVRHFLDAGFQTSGLDINQPMLDLALQRCPEATFSQQEMCGFRVSQPLDLLKVDRPHLTNRGWEAAGLVYQRVLKHLQARRTLRRRPPGCRIPRLPRTRCPPA